MNRRETWLERPVAALSLFAGAGLLSLWALVHPGGGTGLFSAGEDSSHTVILRHRGIDAQEMERTAAIPLEDALSSIPGLSRIVSSSENGRVRVSAFFRGPKQASYDAVREAAQTVYETLPPSAQRPQFVFSGDRRLPVWTAAVGPAQRNETQAGTRRTGKRT